MRRAVLPILVVVVVVLIFVGFYFAFRIVATSRPGVSGPKPAPEASPRYPEGDRHGGNESRRGRERSTQEDASCQASGGTCTSEYFRQWQEPGDGACSTTLRNGYPVPDPACTPGGVNPTVTDAVLDDRAWRTRCIRNCETSESEKHTAYRWYGIQAPHGNSGEDQVCELDHLVPLELGGADGLGNIWPQCGPDAAALDDRYFKIKDRVENYLTDQVKAGRMPLDTAQRGIAADWTQYLAAANQYCSSGGRC